MTPNRELGGAWNFRDVADGTAALRPGLLFRSSDLSQLDHEGRAALRRLGIADIADLRSAREIERRGPGRVPDDVAIHLLPFHQPAEAQTAGTDDSPHEQAFQRMLTQELNEESVSAAATRYMLDAYRRFPALPGAQRALRQVFSLLTAGQPVLAHCFAGKDRTGFVVAVVLETIGVDWDAIMADYLRSNDSTPQLQAQLLHGIRQRFVETPQLAALAEARLSDEVLGVREHYLATARQTIDDTHGSLQRYLQVAGISTADVDQLRNALRA